MIISENGLNLIKKFEGCKLNSYLCPANIPTIGYGNTYYENKTKVKIGDVITKDQANKLLLMIIEHSIDCVFNSVKSNVTQNQIDALISFAYNIGCSNFQKSTLLKKVNLNPNDISIKDEFFRWNKVEDEIIPGLTSRRIYEWNLYISK